MKRSSASLSSALVFSILIVLNGIMGCKKTDTIKYPYGVFPDSITVISGLNSAYDDMDPNLYMQLLIYSSSKNSSGSRHDFVQGSVSYTWDQDKGIFGLGSDLTSDSFLTKLLAAVNGTNDRIAPYRLYSPTDGYEYLFFSKDNGSGNLDFYYTMNRPVASSTLPDVIAPATANMLNTTGDEAYICFDANQDTLYFSSSAGGDFDIYQKSRSLDTALSVWLSKPFRPLVKVDSINSTGDDKCPFVYQNIMVFASNRSGGLGGFDLYYSVFKNGKWNSPVNFGPDVNTQYNETCPAIGYDRTFYNVYMIFSSDRPGGKGGYDLYFKGI
jgi:hypothetical protein